jgi:hypothetical protein
MDRVVSLADALFSLRDVEGFDALLQRFRERPTKSCFIEAETAVLFVNAGFDVQICRESGVRGRDFDFIAGNTGEFINVEVTAKEPRALTATTIRNTLDDKRNQVPTTGPAILYIQIPSEWADDGAAIEAAIQDAVVPFFRGSRRFNAVVFIWDALIQIGEGAAVALLTRTYVNPNPRHPIRDLSFLGPSMVPVDLHSFVRQRGEAGSVGGAAQVARSLDMGPAFERWFKERETPASAFAGGGNLA